MQRGLAHLPLRKTARVVEQSIRDQGPHSLAYTIPHSPNHVARYLLPRRVPHPRDEGEAVRLRAFAYAQEYADDHETGVVVGDGM